MTAEEIIVSFVLSVVAGVAASYIYDWLVRKKR